MKKEKTRPWRQRLHDTIYESVTPAGKAFDVTLLILIVASIIVVMLDSVNRWNALFGNWFFFIEWGFTILFTIEYILRLICIKKPWLYVFSFFGLIDLLALIPSYLSIFYAGAQFLVVLRSLRLMRIFRIFKLSLFLSEIKFLGVAIQGSMRKISIFLLVVMTLVIIMGSVMYLVEGGQNGFTSIPESIYWAIVTITTVGYGDISPTNPTGKFVASIVMLMGYAIIAVPTGILTTEMALATRKREQQSETCQSCGSGGHDLDAKFCKYCGEKL